MALDDLIDQLAFGAKAQKTGPCLGLYLSPDTIYIGETHVEKTGKLVVDHLVRIPIPPDPKAQPGATATLNTDFLNDNAKITALIRQSMSQIRWGTKDVMVTLSHHLGLLRYFAMPAVDRRFWRSAVPLEAKKYIPIPFEVLDHDFQVMPLPPDAQNKPRQGALVAVTQKKNLANILGLLQTLGLTLTGIELAPCSVLRVWEQLEKPAAGKTHAQVHFDAGNIRIMIADRGLPVFFREVFLQQPPSLGDVRKIDLGGCVSFAQKQLSIGPLAQMRVSGNIQGLPQWGDTLGQESGTKATIQDTPAQLGIKGGDWGGYAAIGASLRYLSPSPITLDLAAVGRVSEEERRTAKAIVVLSAVVFGVLATMGLFQQYLVSQKNKVLRGLRRDPEIEAIFAGKEASDIERLMNEMRQHRDALPKADPPGGGRMIDILKDVVDAMPPGVWITRMSVNDPMTKSAVAVPVVQISGNASAPTGGVTAEQDLAFRFKDNLLKAPILGKRFPEIQVTVNARAAQDAFAGLGPAELKQALEQRTSFQIIARAKK